METCKKEIYSDFLLYEQFIFQICSLIIRKYPLFVCLYASSSYIIYICIHPVQLNRETLFSKNTQRDFCTKKTVTLEDIHLIGLAETAEAWPVWTGGKMTTSKPVLGQTLKTVSLFFRYHYIRLIWSIHISKSVF